MPITINLLFQTTDSIQALVASVGIYTLDKAAQRKTPHLLAVRIVYQKGDYRICLADTIRHQRFHRRIAYPGARPLSRDIAVLRYSSTAVEWQDRTSLLSLILTYKGSTIPASEPFHSP